MAPAADGIRNVDALPCSSMRDAVVNLIRRHSDEALAAALTALALFEIFHVDEPESARLTNAAVVLILGAAAARRVRAPLLLLGLMLIISVTSAALPQLGGRSTEAVTFFLLLAVYSAAAHTSGRGALLAGAMTLGLYITDLTLGSITPEVVVFLALLLGLPWVAGRAMRGWRLSEQSLEQEKRRTAAAIAEERARIARELHDVVAHSISVMVLQARGGRRIFQSDPADARQAFAIIERTGHQALEEMRRLLGMLRQSDEKLPLAPQPSLGDLGSLVEQVRAAGLPVQLAVEGEARELPAGVDLSAYRIVQEALTNALLHAGPASARVLVRYRRDDLELEITDDGPGTGDGSAPGYGLIGMRERVSVYGGELQAGRRPEGGYALRVRLPLGSVGA
jgi:signal transduction histidine kinase